MTKETTDAKGNQTSLLIADPLTFEQIVESLITPVPSEPEDDSDGLGGSSRPSYHNRRAVEQFRQRLPMVSVSL